MTPDDALARIERHLENQNRMLAEQLNRMDAKLDRVLAERAAQHSIDQTDTVAVAHPDNRVDDIRQSAQDMGISVFADTVSEADAARLLGQSALTLRNRRLTDQPIPFERVGRSIRYRLDALAQHPRNGT